MQKWEQSWWIPGQFARLKPNLELRHRVLQGLRGWFLERDFLEVETPALQVSPGMEPHLHAFSTEWLNPEGGTRHTYHLHTSPEFAMKKLLTAGLPRIFQMARVFRNRERSTTHHPEFTMLEWYRAREPWTQIMDDCESLLQTCARAAGKGEVFTRGSVSCDPFASWERISVQDLFIRHTEIDLLATIDRPGAPTATRLRGEAEKIGIRCQDSDSWDDIFFRVWLERIEHHLGVGAPTIVKDYPISMAALSRPQAENPALAERFEVYVCGLELANAFGELTDARVQRARFEADMKVKERLYGYRYPLDEEFLAALEAGYPESSGIALGVDRLVMLAAGADSIEDVLWVPVARG